MGNPVQKPILWDRDLVAKMWQIFQNASDTLASCLHLVYILFASCLREHPFATAQPLKTSAAARTSFSISKTQIIRGWITFYKPKVQNDSCATLHVLFRVEGGQPIPACIGHEVLRILDGSPGDCGPVSKSLTKRFRLFSHLQAIKTDSLPNLHVFRFIILKFLLLHIR